MSELTRTSLYPVHLRLGARMVEFAGFEMPVQYGSIIEEHRAVRERAGLFDVSHMGQIHFQGRGAVAAVERLVSCPVASLRPGRVRYGLLCNYEGGVVDDVTVYREAEDALFLCVNAANIAKDEAWIRAQAPAEAEIENRSHATGLLALQGPRSPGILASLIDGDALSSLGRFAFASLEVAGIRSLVSRTGYTGAPGFEIYLPTEHAPVLFDALLGAGAEAAGLGARDTLRLEAALALYGHELDDTTSPLEAGLERFVKRETGGFIGAEAIEKRAAQGHPRALVGFELEARGIARAGYAIASQGQDVGVVTSGAPSPTLGLSIGLGYVPPALATVAAPIDIVIRGQNVPARVVQTPFVRKDRRGTR